MSDLTTLAPASRGSEAESAARAEATITEPEGAPEEAP